MGSNMNINATLIGELLGLVLFLTPLIWSLSSRKVKGLDKLIWFSMSLVFSWLGFLVFYYVRVKELNGLKTSNKLSNR